MRTTLTLIFLWTVVAGCSTSPDERPALKYYVEKDRQEAQLQQKKQAPVREGPVDGLFGGIGNISRMIGDRLNDTTPAQLVRKMEDAGSADARWWAINQLVKRDFARRPPYTTRFTEIAAGDPPKRVTADKDYVVRGVAVRALNRSRERSTAAFVRALSDPSELVRLEAAKALNNLPDPAATGPLMQVVTSVEEAPDVRIAAAEALRHYGTLEVARQLIGVLNDRNFAIAWQARRSLTWLTKNDLGYDQGKWLAFLTGPQKPFG